MSDDPWPDDDEDAVSPPETAPKVVVAGSLNIDYVSRVGRFPGPGETVAASESQIQFGGKGANQAVSAARQDADVVLIGSLGDDEMARAYRTRLENEGVRTEMLRIQPGIRTGSAFIAIDEEGENTIIVSQGANAITAPEDVIHSEALIQQADVFLGQFEIPISTIVEAARAANLADVTVVINPSPVRSTFPWDEVMADFVIVNESEVIELLEFLPSQLRDYPLVRQQLEDTSIGTLIVTRGSSSTLIFPEDELPFEVPTMAVLPIDTVGAGDAFAGCFAARIAAGETVLEAVKAANCAGALATLGHGAQGPIPDRDQVNQHVEQLG